MSSLEYGRSGRWARLLTAAALLALVSGVVIITSAGNRTEVSSPASESTLPAGLILLVGPLLAMVAFISSVSRVNLRRDYLRTQGIPGKARFRALTMSTRLTGTGPVMGIETEISVPGTAPYRKVLMLAPVVAGRFAMEPERHFAVLVDPGDPMNVLFETQPEPGDTLRSDLRASFGSRERTTDHPSGHRTAVPGSLSPSCC